MGDVIHDADICNPIACQICLGNVTSSHTLASEILRQSCAPTRMRITACIIRSMPFMVPGNNEL